MMTLDKQTIVIGAALAIVAIVATKSGRVIGQAAGSTAVDLVDGTISGAVVSTGEIFGIPATNVDQCQADIAAGKTWAASFSCPAKTFIKYIFGSKAA